MNCVERFSHHSKRSPDRCALWLTSERGVASSISYGELETRAVSIQQGLVSLGVKTGDPVLVVLGLGFDLYATVVALLALGCPILLVEPWLPVERIEKLVRDVAPRAMVSGLMGRIWGLRTPAIRAIARHLNPSQARARGLTPGSSLHVEQLDPSHLGILTFTSGTTGGTPKGVMRTQGYLLSQLEVFENRMRPSSVDWCIFANFAIANLGLGGTSLLMPRNWSTEAIRSISQLQSELQPQSLTCGPAFLERVCHSGLPFPSLKEIHVGGALTDCSVFENAFETFKDAHFTHAYGSTEVEPVALMDAREAVPLSRRRGLLQTLALGRCVPEIRHETREGALWVTGAHVCPRYWGDSPENLTAKRTDPEGRVWHCMGDRIEKDPDGILWYSGRSSQPAQTFELEQRVYQALGHTRAFVHHDREGKAWLLGEGVVAQEREIRKRFPSLHAIEELRVIRDARHRARIDRQTSILKGARWLAG